MKVKEILELKIEDLEKMMTEEEYDRMIALNLSVETLLDALKDSARLSEQDEDEEHITISTYLNYLEDIQNNSNDDLI